MVLEGHDYAGDGVPEQRVSENGAAAETVGDETDQRGSDEQPGEHGRDELSDARGRRQNAGPHQSRRDVAGEEDVVELEKAPQRDQRDARPNVLRSYN